MIRLGSQNEWIKSSRSTGYNNCVEVRSAERVSLEIKDSKVSDGPVLKVSPSAFTEFARSI